jgi:hypothetical protein
MSRLPNSWKKVRHKTSTKQNHHSCDCNLTCVSVFPILGEKLSKQILQRNTNIKKLRAKEKELNASNENIRCVNILSFIMSCGRGLAVGRMWLGHGKVLSWLGWSIGILPHIKYTGFARLFLSDTVIHT